MISTYKISRAFAELCEVDENAAAEFRSILIKIELHRPHKTALNNFLRVHRVTMDTRRRFLDVVASSNNIDEILEEASSVMEEMASYYYYYI